ncbi:hypothetical protein Tcan_01373, partial [Toxocara canis]
RIISLHWEQNRSTRQIQYANPGKVWLVRFCGPSDRRSYGNQQSRYLRPSQVSSQSATANGNSHHHQSQIPCRICTPSCALASLPSGRFDRNNKSNGKQSTCRVSSLISAPSNRYNIRVNILAQVPSPTVAPPIIRPSTSSTK